MRLDKFKCPKCKAKRGVEISYGLTEWIETDKRKGVRLQGGCVIYIGGTPDFKCQRCGHGWRRAEITGDTQLASSNKGMPRDEFTGIGDLYEA